MELVYSHETSFTDLNCRHSLSMNHLSTHPHTTTHSSKQLEKPCPPSSTEQHKNKNASILCNLDNNLIHHATVTPNNLHVTSQNTDDINIVANVIDHIITTQGPKQSLHQSIHAPSNQSIITLSPRDLRHKLNSLRHKSRDHHQGFALIYAADIPGHSRIDKLDHIRALLAPMPGYVDMI